MHKLILFIFVAVSGINALGATPQLSDNRVIQTLHPSEMTELSPNHGFGADPQQLKAFEASVQRPFVSNQYHVKLLRFFAENPLVAFATIFLLMLSLPVVVSFRHHS